jgi:hypothetical protein
MNLVTETTIEELRGYEEALSSELEALMATLSDRESMSQEEFDGRMAGAHELETRLQSVRWDIELSKVTLSNALVSNDVARTSLQKPINSVRNTGSNAYLPSQNRPER